MAKIITLQPSGREFSAERGESILDAALRSGLSLEYSCSNGSCGDCKVKLVSGRVSETQHHDFVFSDAEKHNGMVLLCSATPESDVVIQASEIQQAEDIPLQRITASVTRIERPTADVLVLNLRTPRSNTLRFLAGQHVRLEVNGLPPRNKSIASCPCNGMMLHIHIRRVPGDVFSEYMFTQLRPRQEIVLEGPYGNFILDDASVRPIIFVAYETGFAPIKSLIEHAIALELAQPMYLYWVARHAGDHYLENYCRAWQDALDNFHFVPLVCEEHGGEVVGLTDPLPVDVAVLSLQERALLMAGTRVVRGHPDLSGFDVYVNGPPPLLEPTRDLLLSHRLPAERLFVDSVRRYKL